MKLGILGGSFNPVHLGHLFLADTVLAELKLDRVIFIPTFCSPFKLDAAKDDKPPDANDRLDMLAAAITGDSRFALDDCEIRREGVSYTVNTLEDIIARYLPEGKPVLIIGDDLAADFPKWKESDKILELADIVIARRVNPSAADFSFAHTIIDNEVMNISSQTVRCRIGEDSGWRSLVPSGVRAIIEDRQLYGYGGVSSEDCTQINIQRVEAAARQMLSTERFLHSRNTAIMASDMCRRFGINPAAGYLAGIAHDLAKQLDSKLLIKLVKKAELGISELEKEKPNLLHGKAAAALLEKRFCIHNKDVLEAVASHTSGSECMGPLAKVIYIADKIESSRSIDPVFREMCLTASNLDSVLLAVIEKTVFKLQSKKLVLSNDTLMLLNKIKKKAGSLN